MSKADKRLYKSLKFFANHNENKAMDIKKNNPKKYLKHVPEGAEDSLNTTDYIHLANPPSKTHSAITTKGLEQLRILEDNQRKNWTLWISIIAILISLVALFKSFGAV